MDGAYPQPLESNSVLLVVDDYPENLISMRALLARKDWQVLTASSGMEALSALLEHDVDLVLLDVQMPEMDGFEVARLMRGSQRTRLTPIIFLTANEQSDAAVLKGYASGAVDYLFKPFDPQILKPKVQAQLDQQRNRRMLQRLTRELEAARAFNASILENAAEGILVVDAAGTISFANPAISHLLQAPVEQLQGVHLLDLVQLPNATLWHDSEFHQPIWYGAYSASTMPICARLTATWCPWRCPARHCLPTSRRWWSRCSTCRWCATCTSNSSTRPSPIR